MSHVHKTLIRQEHPTKNGADFVSYPNVLRKEWCGGLKTWWSNLPSKQSSNVPLLQVEWPYENVEKYLKSGRPPHNVLKECSKGISKVWTSPQFKQICSTRKGMCISNSNHHQKHSHGCHKPRTCGSTFKSCERHLQKWGRKKVSLGSPMWHV